MVSMLLSNSTEEESQSVSQSTPGQFLDLEKTWAESQVLLKQIYHTFGSCQYSDFVILCYNFILFSTLSYMHHLFFISYKFIPIPSSVITRESSENTKFTKEARARKHFLQVQVLQIHR